MFQEHMKNMNPCNPLKVFIQSTTLFPSYVLLEHLRRDVVYEQYRATVAEPSHYALQAFLRRLRAEHLKEKGSTLIQYIGCRTKSLVDKVVYAPSGYQADFISWRAGRLFIRKKCICGERFHRRHLPHINHIILRLVPAKQLREYEDERSSYSKNYTIIDSLLNHERWKLVGMIFKEIKKLFQPLEEIQKNLKTASKDHSVSDV